MRVQRTAQRALLGLTTLAVAAGTALVGPAAQAATPQATATSGWLVSGLKDGVLVTSFQGEEYPNDGVTLDAALAMQKLQIRGAARDRIVERFRADGAGYWSPSGNDSAGGLGKTLTVVQQEGIAPDDFVAGLDERLEGRLVASGTEAGRASDEGPNDYSNTVTQSFVVRALALAGSDDAGAALGFLLKQQCANGFFRTFVESADGTCDGGTRGESGPSVDSTAFAVLALRQVQRSGVAERQRAVRLALADAESWLVARQAPNGSFGDGGVRNANSTGMAAQALAELGRGVRARAAGQWVAGLRVTPGMAQRTALEKADVGAIAYNAADLAAAKNGGISEDKLYYWQNASAQGLFSQGLLR